MAIFPIKKKPEKKPEKKPKVQDSDKFLHQIDIELIVGTYLNSNDITMTDENHKKLLEDALSYFYETLDDYDMRGSEDYMPTPNEYRFLFRDAKEADVLEDDIIGFVENYNVEDNEDTLDNAKIQDEELTVDELWYVLVDGDYFTEAELELLTDINGYSIDTLNDAIYARYGYSDYEQFAEDRLLDSKIPFETIFWGIYDNEFDLPFDKTVEYIHEKYADKIWQDENADGDLSVLTDEEKQDIIEFAKDEALNWDSIDIYNSHARYKSDQAINDQLEKYFGIKNTKMYKMQDNKINIPELLKKEIEALGDKSRKADLDKAIATIEANEAYPMVYDVYTGSLIEQERDNLLKALRNNKDLTVFDYGGMLKVLTKEDELKLMEDQ